MNTCVSNMRSTPQYRLTSVSLPKPVKTISSDVSPIDDPEALVETRQQPVDSPEVLFDPILDPIEPGPGTDPGGPETFLNDPIPSIEEELRAIQQAKESALPAEDGGV